MTGEDPSVIAWIGVSMICRILDTIVITEIYRSPPVTESTLLQQIVTRLLVSCMIKPAVPRLIIFFARLPQSWISSPDRRRTFNSVFFRRKYRTNAAERICDNTVAIAAPRIPSPNTKIKTGSRIRLAIAPIATENIPVVAYPCALINGFIPVETIEGKVPIR